MRGSCILCSVRSSNIVVKGWINNILLLLLSSRTWQLPDCTIARWQELQITAQAGTTFGNPESISQKQQILFPTQSKYCNICSIGFVENGSDGLNPIVNVRPSEAFENPGRILWSVKCVPQHCLIWGLRNNHSVQRGFVGQYITQRIILQTFTWFVCNVDFCWPSKVFKVNTEPADIWDPKISWETWIGFAGF